MPKSKKNLDKSPKSQKNTQINPKMSRYSSEAIALRPDSTDFAKLQAKWYAKAAAKGFKDIERFHPITGEPLEYISGQSLRTIADGFNPLRETYFRRIRNFVTHNPRWGKTYVTRKIADFHAEGVSYRDMIKKLAKKGHKMSIYKIFYWVRKLEKAAFKWNKTHPEGLDFESDLIPVSLRD